MRMIKSLFGIITITSTLVLEIHAGSLLNDGLVAYYPFKGNVADASGNGNDGIVNAGSIYSTNVLGTANASYVFDGSQGISIPNSPSLNTGNQLTLSAWINFGLGGSFNPRIISKKGSQGYQFLTLGTGSQRQIAFYADTTAITTVQAVNAGEWVYLAATSDGTNVSIYINGILDSSTAGSGVFSNANDLAIGENGDNSLDNFIGLMSDVRIYNRALSPAEISQLYAFESPMAPLLKCQISITIHQQGANRDNGVNTKTAGPKVFKCATKDILKIMAVDEQLLGKWPSSNFPKNAELATDGSHFFVVAGTNILVNVSDIMTLDVGNKAISSGVQNDSTGLAFHREEKQVIAKLTFDDTQIIGSQNLNFYLQGILRESISDTTPISNNYKETITGKMDSGEGEGASINVDFMCRGSITVSGKAKLSLY